MKNIFNLVIILFISIICISCNNEYYKEKYVEVYYNVPTYTTIYEIIYPDSVYRYTAIHHSPSKLASSRGSNYLYSRYYDVNSWGDRDCPKYWKNEWNDKELNIETTAPIRIVSETVKYNKVKFKVKNN